MKPDLLGGLFGEARAKETACRPARYCLRFGIRQSAYVAEYDESIDAKTRREPCNEALEATFSQLFPHWLECELDPLDSPVTSARHRLFASFDRWRARDCQTDHCSQELFVCNRSALKCEDGPVKSRLNVVRSTGVVSFHYLSNKRSKPVQRGLDQ